MQILIKIMMLFFFWKPKKWRKAFKMKVESRFYTMPIRRRAKKCGRNVSALGPGVNVTPYTTIGSGTGFGKDVKIRGDGPVTIGRFTAIAEDTLIYTQVHDYDHSKILPFGSGFTYPETRIDDFAWIGMRSIILPGAHIGEGAVIQAGSVVMGKIPPCAIAAGNPAKVIGWRDIDHYNGIKAQMGEAPVSVAGVTATRIAAPVTKPDDVLSGIFREVFSVTPEEAVAMEYKNHPAWDSAGQMALVAAIEREYSRNLSPEDIYRLRSYADALAIVNAGPAARPVSGASASKTAYTGFFNLDRDGIALICDGRQVTFRELKAVGEELVKGIRPRSVKFIKASASVETVALYAACINHGIVPLMLPEKIDSDLYAKLLATYENAAVHDDLALLVSTSGSTGSPKLVRTSYANLKADDIAAAADHRVGPGDVFLVPLPLCYAFGIQIMSLCLDIGVTLVISSKTVMDPAYADLMESVKATHFVGVPYMYEMMDRLGYFNRPFPALRNLSISGGALGPALRRKYARWAHDAGKVFCEIYGQTETLAYMAKLETSEHLDRVGSIGKASSDGSFEVKDSGALVYRGPIVAMGYAVCAEDLLKGDEWKGVRETGDNAVIDADGYVTLTGRASRFVKIFGNRVSLQDVENILKDNYPESSCAAVGGDNNLHVFVTGIAAGDVERFLVAKLRFNSTVMKVHSLESMPLNANGKTDYAGLEKMTE